MHWRGIALTTFDGRRWYTESTSRSPLPKALTAGSTSRSETPADRRYSLPLEYTVLLEPMASDALFVAAEPDRIRGDFFGPPLPGPPASPHLSRRGQDRLALQSVPQFRTCVTTPSPSCPKSPRSSARLGADLSRKRFAIPICNCRSSIRAFRRWPRQSPREPSTLTTRRAPSKAICATTTATRWTSAARRPPIRWPISFSRSAPAIANISPRP